MIAVVDSGAANIGSVRFAVNRLGVVPSVTSSPAEIERASHVIVPGVGSAGHCMANLQNAGLLDVEAEMMDGIAKMQNDESVSIIFRSASAGKAQPMGDGRYVAVRDYNFTARITSL